MSAHLTLVLEIALVCHDDNREVVLVLHACSVLLVSSLLSILKRERARTQDLLVEGANLLERVARGDRVHEQESLPSPHVLLPHGSADTRTRHR